MNITKGPMLQKFADVRGMDVSEVVDWLNQYVNHPELASAPEPTEKERFDSIKAYVQRRISESSNARIRASIAEEKRVAA